MAKPKGKLNPFAAEFVSTGFIMPEAQPAPVPAASVPVSAQCIWAYVCARIVPFRKYPEMQLLTSKIDGAVATLLCSLCLHACFCIRIADGARRSSALAWISTLQAESSAGDENGVIELDLESPRAAPDSRLRYSIADLLSFQPVRARACLAVAH